MIKNIPDPQRIHSVSCTHCHESYIATHLKTEPKFCVACGASLKKEKLDTPSEEHDTEPVTLIKGHEPLAENIKFTIGRYQVISSLGRGGMGEVFLAYDTICGRRIALKKIREDIKDRPHIMTRFLKEARITSQLTHPAIIPIYTINPDTHDVYYTMPFVEGKTLKEILREARHQEKKGETTSASGSIPSLVRIFITVCQAIAYAHSKGVLHRDLKPENIIVGKYGEVLILDWGLAKLLEESSGTKQEKIVGTLSYMPPERAKGVEANETADIFALGVILYQILTLKMPFHRLSLKDFKKNAPKEVFIDPVEAAPWREVPQILSRACKKCLALNPRDRYETAAKLIYDLENYIEGRAEFFPIASLNISKPDDWEFQENVLIAEHLAITQNVELSDWVNLMISKAPFSENLKLETTFTLKNGSQGLGFLVSIPESSEREHLNDGYCLWLGTAASGGAKLLRSTIEVLEDPQLVLETEKSYRLKIKKNDKNLQVWINEELALSYVSHIPWEGTHIGLLSRDFEFEMSDIVIFEGSQNILVNCLAVPDAFLAHKDYHKALSEYRRIAYSFPGRTEGREALFRAGVTLLEQGLEMTDIETAHSLFNQSMKEFEKLKNTPGAPLEYLGKSLVYRALHDYEEEVKCFELALRRYVNHPLLHVLEEQIFFRMYESSQTDRRAAYSFILMILQHLPHRIESHPVKKLLDSMTRHAEPLYFLSRHEISLTLAFWLAKPYAIFEILEDTDDQELIISGWYALRELGAAKLAENLKIQKNITINECEERYLILTLNEMLDEKNYLEVWDILHQLPKRLSLPLSCLKIKAALWLNKIDEAGQELMTHSLEAQTSTENTLLPFLYGCWLLVTEGKELSLIHYCGVLEATHPRSWTLGEYFLIDKLPDSWFRKSFSWEKKELARQLALYYHLAGDTVKEELYFKQIKMEKIDPDCL